MVWTNLAALGIGLGIGTVGGWWIGRSRPSAFSHSVPSSAIPLESTLPDSPSSTVQRTEPSDQQIWLAELRRTQLAYQMAKETAKFQAGFLARTSHELRSPINSVISLHQIILADLCEDPAEERDFIVQANTAAQKMLALLDELIKVSKAVHDNEKLQIQPLELQDVLAEVQMFTHLQAQNRNLRLEIELPDSDIYVLADPRWLRQVLVSLIDTPISLMQEGCVRLNVQLPVEGDRVNLWIEDERPASFWQDPIDLMDSLQQDKQPDPLTKEAVMNRSLSPSASPGLTLLINQTLLELMSGRLEVLAIPSITDDPSQPPSTLTRIQCSIPLASEEGGEMRDV
ncbi:MAG: HAMP domain-containing histidine kinase [Cyanobacteria bacterium CRU_2_1]|nr:HAMP domain-containing histidine kinase [Cyanobacteria bacterium RU_5_0]NJR60830.1 HAMP domain-containing histidine kinase [Cyanobacteria bacterium CRU_2_1]